MPLLDDLSLPLTESEMERRRFLGLVGGGALGIAMLGTAVVGVRYLEPSVFFEQEARFGAGRPEDIPVGTVLVFARQKVFLVRGAGGFYALSAVCTHLGCIARYQREQAGFACPCHGSRFALDGAVTGGPAPRRLPRLHLALEKGVLIVDAAKVVPAGTLLEVAT